jgi:hypothetical protein
MKSLVLSFSLFLCLGMMSCGSSKEADQSNAAATDSMTTDTMQMQNEQTAPAADTAMHTDTAATPH